MNFQRMPPGDGPFVETVVTPDRKGMATGLLQTDWSWKGRFVWEEEIQEVFQEGATLKRFAERFAISCTVARQILENNGVEFTRLLAEENARGASINQLSRIHGPKPATISRWIEAAGFEVHHGHQGHRRDDERLVSRFQKTRSVGAAAMAAGVSRATARKRLDECGVRPLPKK